MDDNERTRLHLIEAQRQAGLADTIPEDTIEGIVQLLQKALKEIRATLGAQPTEWQTHHLSLVKASVNSALGDFKKTADAALSRDALKAWHAGIDKVDLPIEAAGVPISQALPILSTKQLVATQVFLTDRIEDVTAQAITRINAELGLVVLGVKTPGEVTTELARILNVSRARALTITRTELGRAYETAAQQRRDQAKEVLPGLKKQWRRSGKIHSRVTHDTADGQIREVDEPFLVDSEELMFPRDPKGSAKNTINCGCSSLNYMEHWDMKHPGKKPFTPEEIAAQPIRRDLQKAGVFIPEEAVTRKSITENLTGTSFASWLKKPSAEPQAVGLVDTELKSWTGATGSVTRLSQDTMLKQLVRHPDLTDTDYQRLPEILANGMVLRDGGLGGNLVIYFDEGRAVYRAVLKVTADASELYLVSLTRSYAEQAARATKSKTVLRKQK